MNTLEKCKIAIKTESLSEATELLTGAKITTNKSSTKHRIWATQLKQKYSKRISNANENDQKIYDGLKETSNKEMHRTLSSKTGNSSPIYLHINHAMSSLRRHFLYKPLKGLLPHQIHYTPLHSPDPLTKQMLDQLLSLEK
jgi:murein L,D-transpeptidase YafK